MLIPTSTVINDKSLLGHAILHCMPHDFDHEKSREKGGVEISFKIEGKEVDLANFLTFVEGQMDRMVNEEATKRMREKLHPIMNILSRLDEGALQLVKILDEKEVWS